MSDIFSTHLLRHIFNGDLRLTPSGKLVASGFHYEGAGMQMMYGTRIIEGSRSKPDVRGVYSARVKIGGIGKRYPSIFFPRAWTRAQVLEVIKQAYANRRPTSYVDNKCQWWCGEASCGMVIKFFIDGGTIQTVTPIRGAILKTPAEIERRRRQQLKRDARRFARECLPVFNLNSILANQVSCMGELAGLGGDYTVISLSGL